MKKLLVLVYMTALLVGLAACAFPVSAQEPVPSSDPASVEQLSAILKQIRENVSIGTAGSSLRAAAAAAALLDWAENAEISEEQIAAALAPWLAAQEDGIPVSFAEQLGAVNGLVTTLTGESRDSAEGLLSDAGCTESAYPWSQEALATVERLMTLGGISSQGGGN